MKTKDILWATLITVILVLIIFQISNFLIMKRQGHLHGYDVQKLNFRSPHSVIEYLAVAAIFLLSITPGYIKEKHGEEKAKKSRKHIIIAIASLIILLLIYAQI